MQQGVAPEGDPLVLGGSLRAGSRPWLLCAAVRRALAFGGWPPRIFPLPRYLSADAAKSKAGRARSGHQLGQQCCPMRNMAESRRKHKGAARRRAKRIEPWAFRLEFRQCPAWLSGPRAVRKRNGSLAACFARVGAVERRVSVAGGASLSKPAGHLDTLDPAVWSLNGFCT
jgi:hypothetical protein